MEELNSPLAAGLLLIAIAASLGLWACLFAHWRRGRRVLPRQMRRPVPWGGREAIGVFLIHLMTLAAMSQIFSQLVPTPSAEGPEETTHFAIRLLLGEHNPWAIAWAVMAVVLITPLAEEFVYRLVIQGWLESTEPLLRRRFSSLRRLPGVLPLLFSAGLFAFLHARGASPRIDSTGLLLLLTGMALGNLLVVLSGVCWLRFGSGATWADLGWEPRRIPKDVALGLLGYLAALAPVFLVQWIALCLLPEDVAPDPAGIFIFALSLGWLYQRTHRLTPSIVCHMALNAQTVLLILLAVWAG